MEIKLLTRRDIIKIWQKSNSYLDSYCCPNCRDILSKISDHKYVCENFHCNISNNIIDTKLLLEETNGN
jgi:hypothetical protein